MPINNPMQSVVGSFDPNDEESWFFGFMSRADATELLLNNNEIGAFLVRESTTAPGDLVLSVRESDQKVSHYIINKITSQDQQVRFKIGEQWFSQIPALLAYYKSNNLDDTPLRATAVPRIQSVHNKRSFTKDYLAEIKSDVQAATHQLKQPQQNLIAAAANHTTTNYNTHQKIVALTSLQQRKLPGLAKVIQTRIPNAYDKTALTLHEGDIVRVTKVDVNGCWEGEVSGRKGHFPFKYVEFIDDQVAP